jgi:hypothetical protein
MSQRNAELTVWPASTNPLWTKIMLLTLVSVSLDLSIQTPVHGSCLLTQGLRFTFSKNCKKILCTLSVGYIAKSHRAQYTISNKRVQNISRSTPRREMLCIYSQDMLVLPSTVASRCYNLCTNRSSIPWNYGFAWYNVLYLEYNVWMNIQIIKLQVPIKE